jgi:hypothetical protein
MAAQSRWRQARVPRKSDTSGVLACWRAGVLACWRAGVLACRRAARRLAPREITDSAAGSSWTAS